MSPTETSMMDRLADVVPKPYREEMVRFARRVRDRLPPVMIERRIEALERHIDRRLGQIEAKLDAVLARLESRHV